MIRRASVLVIFVMLVSALVPLLGPARSANDNAAIAAGRVHKRFQPRKGKIFVLVIGSDARNGNPNLRADAIHIAGINTRTMRGGILNFPRDSWVNIPGRGSAKINEALYIGGPTLLAKTLEAHTGIRIDYWVMVGFEGFQDIIKAVGPIQMRIPSPIYDPGGSGAHLRAGKKKLYSIDSLAFVRTRKAFSGGDVTRTTNQGRFLLAMLRELRNDIERDPAVMLNWIAATRRHARLNISAQEIFRLGILTSQVKPSDVGNVTVPVSLGSVGAASVVFIRPEARAIYGRFKKKGSL
jgi:polyisoprenyl-teichoic acid--peptidoglycan teichoic acid transferase